jgi:hypothetical protein
MRTGFASSAAFALQTHKRETPRMVSRSAERDQGSAFGNRKLLEKLDQNFYKSAIARTTPSGYQLEIFAKLPRALGAGTALRISPEIISVW